MNSVDIRHNCLLQKWSGLIREQQDSPLTVKEWLFENNIPKYQFYYWKRKLKDTIIDNIVQDFVELPVIPVNENNVSVAKVVKPLKPDTGESVASIRIGSSEISIYGNASKDFLKNLLEALPNA